MLHNEHVLDYEHLMLFWKTDDINRTMWLEDDYAKYITEQEAITSVFYKDEIEL
jgi:hypothetical protein